MSIVLLTRILLYAGVKVETLNYPWNIICFVKIAELIETLQYSGVEVL